MIVDFHVHMLKYDSIQPWVASWLSTNLKEDYDTCLERCGNPEYFTHLIKESGVDYAVVLAEYAPLTTGQSSNESVLNFCRDNKSLIPFCNINPFLSGQGAQELKRFVNKEGFRGLKLYPTYNYFFPNDRMLYPIYSMAEELQIPVMFHTGSSIFQNSRIKYGNPLFLDDITVDFPDLTLIMAHSGRGCWYQEAFLMAQIHPKVYMEISGLPVKRIPQYFPEFEKLGHKIIFGSDYPGLPTSIKKNIEDFKNLGYSEKTIQLVLGQTASEILGL